VKNILFQHPALDKFISEKDYCRAAKLLLEEQKKSWEALSKNYNSLNYAKVKSFQFPGYVIKVQFNPGRIKSTSAEVDEKFISERKCFLCADNLYEEQKAIKYDEDFLILVNPFPIFPEHFTIPHKDHIPQRIKDSFGKMLSLSKDLSGYVIIYNGPECGASAPDHLHFQAGNKNFLPVYDEFQSLKNEYGNVLTEINTLKVTGINDGLRNVISIETSEIAAAEKVFDLFYNIYSKISENKTEPLLNILSFYEKDYNWRVLIFLRKKHRSSHYFKEGKDRILVSPAAVDLGGICILPLEEDFEKITQKNIEDVFKEVNLNKEQFEVIETELKKYFK
jgi:ATP adenylyltransferase/5',5'''-P-1,P-4-tetraphosphate phosphorylase II